MVVPPTFIFLLFYYYFFFRLPFLPTPLKEKSSVGFLSICICENVVKNISLLAKKRNKNWCPCFYWCVGRIGKILYIPSPHPQCKILFRIFFLSIVGFFRFGQGIYVYTEVYRGIYMYYQPCEKRRSIHESLSVLLADKFKLGINGCHTNRRLCHRLEYRKFYFGFVLFFFCLIHERL